MIKAAEEKDIPRILEIERASISPPWTHGALLSEIFNDDSFFALAVEEASIVGFVILRRASDEGELLQIAVDKAARRRGAAGGLMGAALGWARDAGVKSVYLEVRKSNEAAVALYKKNGFIQTGTRKNYYDDPAEDAAVMARKVRYGSGDGGL